MYPLDKKNALIAHSCKSLQREVLHANQATFGTACERTNHQIYPIRQLNSVLATLSRDEKGILQFVVTRDKQLLFAREGLASAMIPTHSDMSKGPALAAGYLFLNAQEEVIGLSNESAEFKQQTIQSLLWPVVILQLTQTRIAERFSIIHSVLDNAPLPLIVSEGGIDVTEECQLTTEDRVNIVSSLTPKLIRSIQQANASTEILSPHETTLSSKSRNPVFFTGLTFDTYAPDVTNTKKRRILEHYN